MLEKRPGDRMHLLLASLLMLTLAACGPEGTPGEQAEAAGQQGSDQAEQTAETVRGGEETPQADPADVESPEALETALYDVISGGPDEERDWDRFRSFFRPEARLTVTRSVTPEGEEENILQSYTVEEFAESAGESMRENGFWESGLSSEIDRFGNVAHVFSTYESRMGSPDAEPFARGINSIQMVHDGERWWVSNLVWDAESESNPIPEEYLP